MCNVQIFVPCVQMTIWQSLGGQTTELADHPRKPHYSDAYRITHTTHIMCNVVMSFVCVYCEYINRRTWNGIQFEHVKLNSIMHWKLYYKIIKFYVKQLHITELYSPQSYLKQYVNEADLE